MSRGTWVQGANIYGETVSYWLPVWTKVALRRFAQEYLGEERLPRGLSQELYAYRGQAAFPRSVASLLQRWRKPSLLA